LKDWLVKFWMRSGFDSFDIEIRQVYKDMAEAVHEHLVGPLKKDLV